MSTPAVWWRGPTQALRRQRIGHSPVPRWGSIAWETAWPQERPTGHRGASGSVLADAPKKTTWRVITA